MNSFFDRFGNIKPNSYDSQSENPSTFNAAYYFSRNIRSDLKSLIGDRFDLHPLILNKYYKDSGAYRTMEEDANPDFSLDEKKSIMAMCYFFGFHLSLIRMPWFYTKHLSHFRPDVIAATIYFKGGFIGRMLSAWLLTIKCLISCYEFRKRPQSESSGAQLAFIISYGGRMKFTYKMCEKLVGGWGKVFDIYYPEKEHPTRKIWRSL